GVTLPPTIFSALKPLIRLGLHRGRHLYSAIPARTHAITRLRGGRVPGSPHSLQRWSSSKCPNEPKPWLRVSAPSGPGRDPYAFGPSKCQNEPNSRWRSQPPQSKHVKYPDGHPALHYPHDSTPSRPRLSALRRGLWPKPRLRN